MFRLSVLITLICIFYFYEANFERWCRLRGNLLFYLKSHDQLSDLLGVIVLQNYSVQLDESPSEGPFSFQIGITFVLFQMFTCIITNNYVYNLL